MGQNERHDCKPDEHPTEWHGAGWEGTYWECGVCGAEWFIDLSYGPDYSDPVLYWERDDD